MRLKTGLLYLLSAYGALAQPNTGVPVDDVALPAGSAELRIFHRILNPYEEAAGSGSSWQEKSRYDARTGKKVAVHHELIVDEVDSEGLWYQVAVGNDEQGVDDTSRWPMSSVKLCYLPVSNLTANIHISPFTQSVSGIHLSLSSDSLPKDGSCPSHVRAVRNTHLDMTIEMITPQTIPTLQAAGSSPAMPRVDPQTGETIAAEGVQPEKTFLQKYWMYLFGAMLILGMSGGGGDAPQGGEKK